MTNAVDTKNRFVNTITNPKQSEQSTNAPAITHPTTPLVRAQIIARHFDVNERTVCMWAQNGIIPCVRIGGALRFNLEAVLEAAR